MEVNLVFSNHPETRKEVLHFYDYSSRGYMLPILHAGDSIWQVLIEPVLRFTDNNGFLNLPLWTLPPRQPWESIVGWILNATFLPFVESLEVVKQLSPWCGIGYSKPYALRHPSLNRMCLPFHQSRISNLHCELYHTLLHLSRGFWNFYGRGLISMGRNKRQQNKKPLQACLSFLSLEERCRSQQSFLVVRTLICFQ